MALTAHTASSSLSIGAVAVFLVLAVTGLLSSDQQIARSCYIAMQVTALMLVTPAIFAAGFTGVVQSLGTPWGLFRHYWVIAKLVLTLLVMTILLLQLGLIRHVADTAAAQPFLDASLGEMRASLLVHGAGGLFALLLLLVLSIYKPRGLTRHGWTKQQEQMTRTL